MRMVMILLMVMTVVIILAVMMIMMLMMTTVIMIMITIKIKSRKMLMKTDCYLVFLIASNQNESKAIFPIKRNPGRKLEWIECRCDAETQQSGSRVNWNGRNGRMSDLSDHRFGPPPPPIHPLCNTTKRTKK